LPFPFTRSPELGTVRAFARVVPGPASPTVSPLSGECLNRVDRLLTPTMPSADFCCAFGLPHGSLSPYRTRNRSPEVSSCAFPAQPPDLLFAPLMDMDFVVTSPLVRRSSLLSGSCSSARRFAPRFFQTFILALR